MIERQRDNAMMAAGQWRRVEKGSRQNLDIQTGAIIPAAQAVLVTVSAGVSAGIVVGIAARDPLAGIVAGGMAVGVALLPSALGFTSWANVRSISWELYQAESEAHEEHEQEHARLTIEVKPEGDHIGEWYIADLPVDNDQFYVWAVSVLEGRSLAQSAWTGSAGAFSRSEYDALLDWAVKVGAVDWVNASAPSQGRALTVHGKRMLQTVVKRARTHAHARNGGAFARAHALGVGEGAVIEGGEG